MPPNKICQNAYQNQEPVDVVALGEAMAVMADLQKIDAPTSSGFSALNYIVLNEYAAPKAVQLLLAAGADPFSASDTTGSLAKQFQSTPVAQALQFHNISALKVILRNFEEASWNRLVDEILRPLDITGCGVGCAAGVWVYVAGCGRAKTVEQVLGVDTGKEAMVQFDDGTQATVACSKILALPAVPKAAKALLLKTAKAAGCGPNIMEPIQLLEVGYYGTLPRGWGYLQMSATGVIGLRLPRRNAFIAACHVALQSGV